MKSLNRLYLLISVSLVVLCGCVSDAPKIVERVWTVPEVQYWYDAYKKSDLNSWDGILYRGSDSQFHRFIARVNQADNYAIINIKREDLKLPETRRYSTSTNAAMGYYFVDPSRNFVKLRDFKQYGK